MDTIINLYSQRGRINPNLGRGGGWSQGRCHEFEGGGGVNASELLGRLLQPNPRFFL